MANKRCPKCKRNLLATQFHRNRAQKDGLNSWCRDCSRGRARERIYSSAFVGGDRGKCTAACEMLVRADLLRRGFEVTVPCSPTARHDLHVELPSLGWVGVQVKAASCDSSTGRLNYSDRRRRVRSPILALVFLPTSRIEYREAEGPLPVELL